MGSLEYNRIMYQPKLVKKTVLIYNISLLDRGDVIFSKASC